MDFISFKPFSGNYFLKIEIGIKTLRTPGSTPNLVPLVTDSGPLTPLVSMTVREGTSDERISSAARSPATG